ncbi:hypothetical protein D3C75_234190 [compost metagenome]
MTQLVPDLLGIVVAHRVAHPRRDLADDLPVRFQIPLRLNRFKEALETTVGSGVNPFVLTPGGGRQDHIGSGGRFGHKDILHDDQLQGFKRLTHGRQFRIRLERIFPHDVRRTHFAVFCPVRQFADAIPGMGRQRRHAPGFGELGPVFRVVDVLIARIGIRQRPHVARTLHVVLPAHRVYPCGRFAKVAGQQRQACQGTHGFDALVELGHAHAPQDGGAFRCGIHPRGLADLQRADTGDGFNGFRRVALNDFAILFEAFRTRGDKRPVVQLLFNNHVPHRIQQRDVGAVFQRQVHIGNARGFNFARIADDNLRPFAFGFDHPIRHDRVRIRRVIPKDKNHVGIFNPDNRVTHCAVTDRLVQTCNRWAVSDARATVDIVSADGCASKFLHHIVGFVPGSAR